MNIKNTWYLNKRDENSVLIIQIVSDAYLIVIDSGINENDLNENDQHSNSHKHESVLQPTSTGKGYFFIIL